MCVVCVRAGLSVCVRGRPMFVLVCVCEFERGRADVCMSVRSCVCPWALFCICVSVCVLLRVIVCASCACYRFGRHVRLAESFSAVASAFLPARLESLC